MLRLLFLFSALTISAIANDNNVIIYHGGSNIRYQGSDSNAPGVYENNKRVPNQEHTNYDNESYVKTPIYNHPIYSIQKTSNRTGGTYVRPEQPASPIQPNYPGAASPNYPRVENSNNNSTTENTSVYSLGPNPDASTIPLANDTNLEHTKTGDELQDNYDNNNTNFVSQHNMTAINSESDHNVILTSTTVSGIEIDPYTNSILEPDWSTASTEGESSVYSQIKPIQETKNTTQPVHKTSRPGNIADNNMYPEAETTPGLEIILAGINFTTWADTKNDPTPIFRSDSQLNPQDEFTSGPKNYQTTTSKPNIKSTTPESNITEVMTPSPLLPSITDVPSKPYIISTMLESNSTEGRTSNRIGTTNSSITSAHPKPNVMTTTSRYIFNEGTTAVHWQYNNISSTTAGSYINEGITSRPLVQPTNDHPNPEFSLPSHRPITERSTPKPEPENSTLHLNNPDSATTKQPIHTTDLKNFACSKRYGYNSIANQCDTYVECKNNVPRRRICPDGLHFNPKTMYPGHPCSFPADVKCVGNEFRKNHRPTSECPRQFGFFVAFDGNCSNYRLCQNGKASILQCPLGLVFNEVFSICDWPENVPKCKSNVYKDIACPPPEDYQDKQNDYGYFYKFRYVYYGEKCRHYIVCQRGHPRLHICPEGTSFDENIQMCVSSELVECV